MNGYDATQIIKNNAETAFIPVVALTASTMQTEIDKLQQLFDGYLRKPVQKKTLINEMIKFLPYNKSVEIPLKKSDDIKQKQELAITEISIELAQLFNNEFSYEINSQIDFIMMDKLATLAERIEKFANQHDIPQLLTKSGDLNNNIEAYDFVYIQHCLSSIKALFHK
jgi:CheY-like chemotaxis protein